jgi:hypothetical protein
MITILKKLASIATHVASGKYQPAAQSKFMSGADPWLIAKAQTIGAVVVTHEQPAPDAKSRVPIPDVCKAFGVDCIPPYDALRAMAASFTFKIPGK